MRVSIVLLIACLLVGCQPAPSDNKPTVTPEPTAVTTPTPSTESGGVAPMASGAAGGMTPMAGTDSVQGSGGGSVGMAAKEMAKEKAGAGGGSSLDQMSQGE